MNAKVSTTGVGVSSVATDSSRHLRPSRIRLAVLAIILERPGYGYDIATRVNRRFAGAIHVTEQRVYQVIDDLLDGGLIQEVEHPTSERTSRRAVRQHYAGTPDGDRTHREWLAAGLREDPHRSAMLVNILATSVHDPDEALRLLDLYEQAIMSATPAACPSQGTLQGDLIDRERRMVGEARRRWIAYARERVRAGM